MNITTILDRFINHPEVAKLISSLKTNTSCQLNGLKGSSAACVAAALVKKHKASFVFCLDDKESAAYFYNDLQTFLGEKSILFLPGSFQRSLQYGKIESSNVLLRTEVLNLISKTDKTPAIVTYPEAIMEKVITPDRLKSNTFTVSKGDNLSRDFMLELLTEYEFERCDFVYEPGQYAVRGSLIDVFSFAGDEPFRIDFFGDTIESIRYFDIETQLTQSTPYQVSIIPDIQHKLDDEARIAFFEFMPESTLFWFNDLNFTVERINQVIENTTQDQLNELEKENTNQLVIEGNLLLAYMQKATTIELTNSGTKQTSHFSFNISLQPTFKKNFDLLANHLNELEEQGYANYILSDNQEQISRLNAIFHDREIKASFQSFTQTLKEGFTDHDLKINCFTDHELFDRFHKFHLKTGFTKRESLTIAELTNLHTGDYVVHIDHGIGKFGGLHKIDINGKQQEAIKLIYQDNDVLFVSIHSLHRISKYKGKDTEAPRIHKLGSTVWQNLKARTKSKVKDIAKDLIKLYAERKAQRGHAFSPDSFLNQQLEASFIYEDTPDQLKANQAVKADMEQTMPMDRLICGDVGFGKTEIAIRAAFKAVADNKQVAVLVPTTILALQHYKTFSERLSDFPCNVEYLSRLRSTKHQTEVLKKLKSGEVDIVIGTHKLVSKNIEFKDLGLLVIDEEQKFGVAVKEKLKQIKTNVDTLTLTATPIPRTLQFSLMGARDLSIINTPPPNRQTILTEVHLFSETIIQEAIKYEIERNGQVFFIHNRVQNIADVAAQIGKLCPQARVVFAHGQMDGKSLERIMLEFIDGKYDVLIATTIIESGLDIPNANTIIINQAQNYGLSDLHQLRGRVGRSNKKAFCYLLAPPPTILTNEARRRLKAIEDFSELGSGFNIALQDLDIRGAGDLLGAEQSGFIGDLGFEAYQKILDEAILELKQNELKDYFNDTENQAEKEAVSPDKLAGMRFVSDCSVDTDLELLLPDSYIENITERINSYRKLDNIANTEELEAFKNGLVDRFGSMPQAAEELLEVVKLRWLAMDLGIEKIFLKNNKMILHFISDSSSLFYQSPVFQQILQGVQQYHNICKIQEKNQKLVLTFEPVKSVKKALHYLNKLSLEKTPAN